MLNSQSLSRFIVLVLAGYLISACTPSRQEIEQDVDVALEQEVSNIPEKFFTEADFAEIQVGWIDSFEDATLSRLVKEAQENNKNLAASAANVDRSWSLARQAGAALKPNIAATAGAQNSNQTGSGSLSLGLQANWEIDLWGRIRTGQWAAQASAEATEADYRYAQHSLAASTARAYFTAIESNLQSKIESETVDILEETLRIVRVRFDNGLVSNQDVALSKSDLALARERLLNAQGAYRNSLRSLELLLGRYPAANVDIPNKLPLVPPPPPVGVPSELLERRPDIVAAERRVASAFNATEQAKAARLPTISLTSVLGGASNALSSILSSSNQSWSLGSNLLAPVFDGGVLREQVEISNADQQQALAGYGEAALQAFAEIESALDEGSILVERDSNLEIAVSEADEAYRIADLNYQAGETDLLSALTIQQRVISAKRSLSTVKRLLLEQRINLNLALGGSW